MHGHISVFTHKLARCSTALGVSKANTSPGPLSRGQMQKLLLKLTH